MLVSCAQNLEDIVLWRVLGHVEAGTYVDVGAAEPDVDSVTRIFYERGWSGVNIEPVPAYVERLRAERPRDVTIGACAGSAPGKLALAMVAGTGLSTLSGPVRAELERDGYEVSTIEARIDTLDQLLEEAGLVDREIHFLKVDVEGFEREVLEGFDIGRWRPWIVVVEATHPRTGLQTHDRWEPLLVKAGYRFCLFDGLNRFYCSSDHDELVEVLSYPACVLDQPYVSGPHGQLLDDHRELQTSANFLQAEIARMAAAHDDFEATHQHTLAAYERVEAELARTQSSYRELESELGRVLSAYERVDQDNADLRSALSTLQAGVEEMQREVETMRGAELRVAILEQSLAATLNSTSWRMTAPIRLGLDAMRRLR